jgi:hypothetical protein
MPLFFTFSFQLLRSRMPESTGVAVGFVKLMHLLQFSLVNFLDYHLRDAIPPVKRVCGFA